MIEPTAITWCLVAFGVLLILLPMLYAQLLMALRPHGQRTQDLIIGKGEDWRDETHLRMSLGIAWADLVLWLPLLVIGSIGVLLGQAWGYAFWAAAGAISVYVSVVLWFSEREYVFPAYGPLVYYTYSWGFFVYWGLADGVYAVLRLAEVTF